MHLSADGKFLNRAASTSDGDPLVEPNDIALDPNGGFYFTDPHGSTAARPVRTVHYTDSHGTTRTIATGVAYPNGIVLLSPEGQLLRSYPAGNLTASNVAFGGAAMDQLYVTGALADEQTSPGALWRLDLKGVRGRRLLSLGK